MDIPPNNANIIPRWEHNQKRPVKKIGEAVFGTEQGNTFFQGRDELLFFIARRAIVDGVNKKCYNY